jgi:7-carboxy-7-deazaguanine synthase
MANSRQHFARRLGSAAWNATSEPRLQVSEMFATIQGEGPHSGRPSVFLRLGMCNLKCAWCDTPYTWMYSDDILQKVKQNISDTEWKSPSFNHSGLKVYDKKTELENVPLHQVRTRILSLAKPSTRALVVTGGEPLLHVKPLIALVPQLVTDGFAIEFETNGTISPSGLPDEVHFNVSPKLSNSCQPERVRINDKILSEFMRRPSAVLKFVVDHERDIEEVNVLVDRLGVSQNRVFLMAQGTAPGQIREKGAWIADICRHYGFNYSHRIHVELWGGRRGV